MFPDLKNVKCVSTPLLGAPSSEKTKGIVLPEPPCTRRSLVGVGMTCMWRWLLKLIPVSPAIMIGIPCLTLVPTIASVGTAGRWVENASVMLPGIPWP